MIQIAPPADGISAALMALDRESLNPDPLNRDPPGVGQLAAAATVLAPLGPSLLDPAVLAARETWTGFAPSLHVCDLAYIRSRRPLDLGDDTLRYAERQLAQEGYFQLPAADWGLPLAKMVDVVHRLALLGAPPVLAYHFDEFWMMFAQLQPLLCALLGNNPVMLPGFWAWHIDPKQQDAGWAPHRDKGYESLLEDGRPKIVTLWLPLTDATPLNGCLYIIPADRDPTYGCDDESQQRFNLADIRALPARAGSILGWDQAVLHWGGHAADRQTAPRISVACEFQRRDVEPYNEPLLDPLDPPDFATRQVLIGRQMLHYEHMVHASKDWSDHAERMAKGARA